MNEIIAQLVKNFSAFYVTWKFITVFKTLATGPYLKSDEANPGPQTVAHIFNVQFKAFFTGDRCSYYVSEKMERICL